MCILLLGMEKIIEGFHLVFNRGEGGSVSHSGDRVRVFQPPFPFSIEGNCANSIHRQTVSVVLCSHLPYALSQNIQRN